MLVATYYEELEASSAASSVIRQAVAAVAAHAEPPLQGGSSRPTKRARGGVRLNFSESELHEIEFSINSYAPSVCPCFCPPGRITFQGGAAAAEQEHTDVPPPSPPPWLAAFEAAKAKS
eukprot:6099494-Pleurochrysis_carterae.AAC.1